MSIAINMLVRNGEDFIEPCLTSVLLFVNKTVVTVDSRSDDKTREILKKLQDIYSQLEVRESEVKNPVLDLVSARNEQLKGITEDWVWIIDSDEYYPSDTVSDILGVVKKPQYDTIALSSWAVWNKEQYHVSTTRIPSARLFRNLPNLHWEGKFGKEALFRDEIKLWNKDEPRPDVKILESRYIHFTHVKKDRWREEMKQERSADGRNLRELPKSIKKEIENIL